MTCPLCPTAGWLGGLCGGYFGVQPPPHFKGRLLSAFITASLTLITIIALKVFCGISFCRGGQFTLANILRVGFQTLILGMIYSIGINSLLNKYVFVKG